MLIALHKDRRIDAFRAATGLNYVCPNCHADVVLKQGRIVKHHFAHKPPTDCTWASGETREHMLAKSVIRDAFSMRGYQAEYEAEVFSGAGDRRADVLLTRSDGKRVAIEIQHTPILYDLIKTRTRAYIKAGVPVIWIGILSQKMKSDAKVAAEGILIEKHPIRPWEKWAHAYYFKELWYIDPHERTLWRGRFSNYYIDRELTSWYDDCGEERYAGGDLYKSKRWKTLALNGPAQLSDVNIRLKQRKEWSKTLKLPGGQQAYFNL